jgi:hypothetical protein
MNNDKYEDQQKLQSQLNVRNVQAVVDYMNMQRKQVNELGVELESWKKVVTNYLKIVTDLQREVTELRNEVQLKRFTGRSTEDIGEE